MNTVLSSAFVEFKSELEQVTIANRMFEMVFTDRNICTSYARNHAYNYLVKYIVPVSNNSDCHDICL